MRLGDAPAAIRAAAQNMADGPVTAGYKGDREAVLKMLNDALATEVQASGPSFLLGQSRCDNDPLARSATRPG